MAETIMQMSGSAGEASQHAFDKRVDDVATSKGDINAWILDYLTTKGFPKSAARFAEEANLPQHCARESAQARYDIMDRINAGDVQAAIELLNDYAPQILDEDKALHFSLLRLQLVERIKQCNESGGDIQSVLEFAREQLGPRAPTDPKFLEDLELTMTLVFMTPDAVKEPHIAALLHPNLRTQAADAVNQAILERAGFPPRPLLPFLAKTRAMAEGHARAHGEDLPDALNIGVRGAGPPQNETAEGGHDEIMSAAF